jgi:hypothetical protein
MRVDEGEYRCGGEYGCGGEGVCVWWGGSMCVVGR